MNVQQSPSSTVKYPIKRSESQTRLPRHWLFLARAAWVVLALVVLGLNAGAISHYHAALQTICPAAANCFGNQLTSREVQNLYALGGSLRVFATFTVVVQSLVVLVWVLLGALLFWRGSNEPMALFCSFMLVAFGGASITPMIQVGLEPLSLGWYAVGEVLDFLGQVSFFLFFYLFPSGRFVPRWTRWMALLYAVYCAWTIFTFHPGGFTSTPEELFYLSLILTAVVAQIYRYLRVSTRGQRQQTKWMTFGFVLVIVSFISLFVGSADHFFFLFLINGNTFVTLIFLLIPSSMAIAILRSRLWDIDVIINKALVYGLLTTLLAAIYVGLIFGLENLVGLFSRQSEQPPVIVVSTLVIAALFQPLRRSIQQIIDRRFYRRKYDAARTVEAFSGTLQSEVDLATLSDHLLAVVQETMQPTSVSLWLQPRVRHGSHQVPPKAYHSLPSEDEIREEN